MTTLVLGASLNTERYSNRAIKLLREHNHQVVAVGREAGKVLDVEIITDINAEQKVDTVTMYLNPIHQNKYYNRIIEMKPRRIIFNPGAENPELKTLAEEKGIHTEEACTLVLLNTGQY